MVLKVLVLRMRVLSAPLRHMASAARPLLRGVVFDLDGTLTVPRQAPQGPKRSMASSLEGLNHGHMEPPGAKVPNLDFREMHAARLKQTAQCQVRLRLRVAQCWKLALVQSPLLQYFVISPSARSKLQERCGVPMKEDRSAAG